MVIGSSHRGSSKPADRCAAFVSRRWMQTGSAALMTRTLLDAGDVLATPVASKAKYCGLKHSSEAPASIPCKSMPKKRNFGNDDQSPPDNAQARTHLIIPVATTESPNCKKESCPTTASSQPLARPQPLARRIPCKAMPQCLKKFGAGKTPRRLDPSRASDAGSCQRREAGQDHELEASCGGT